MIPDMSDVRCAALLVGELTEDVFEIALLRLLSEFRDGSVRNKVSFVDDQDTVADAFDDFENVRAVEDRLAILRQRRDEILDEDLAHPHRAR